MGAMASQSPASLLFTPPFIQALIKGNIKAPRHGSFVRGIHRWPVNSPHKWPVAQKMVPFDYVIMPSQKMHSCSIPMYCKENLYIWQQDSMLAATKYAYCQMKDLYPSMCVSTFCQSYAQLTERIFVSSKMAVSSSEIISFERIVHLGFVIFSVRFKI